MFLATFIIGYLPQTIKFNKNIMNLLAIYGAGLLIGAALIIIIPEGMLVIIASLT